MTLNKKNVFSFSLSFARHYPGDERKQLVAYYLGLTGARKALAGDTAYDKRGWKSEAQQVLDTEKTYRAIGDQTGWFN